MRKFLTTIFYTHVEDSPTKSIYRTSVTHINLTTIFYTHVEDSPTKTIYRTNNSSTPFKTNSKHILPPNTVTICSAAGLQNCQFCQLMDSFSWVLKCR